MTAHPVDHQLAAYLLGQTPGGVQAHLDACPDCQVRLAALRATEQALARLGRESRRATYPDVAAGWARVQARAARPAPRFSAFAPARRLAWSAAILALLLVAGLASPLVWAEGRPAYMPPAPTAVPALANLPGTTSPAAVYTLNPTPAPGMRAPATVSGEGTALSQVTIAPEPVPVAPGRPLTGGQP